MKDAESWDDRVAQLLQTYRSSRGNPAWYMVGRHNVQGHSQKPAAVFLSDSGCTVWSYADLDHHSARWAGYLRDLGVKAGTKVATLLPKCPELVAASLGIWRLGAVYVPLFTAFGVEAVDYRLKKSQTEVVLSNDANMSKIPSAVNVQLVNVDRTDRQSALWNDWEEMSSDEPIILLYTSGTTGYPKGVPVPIRALASFEAYMRWGLAVKEDDRFWNIADPGWAYGLYYGLIGPLLIGQANHWLMRPFDPNTAIQTLKDQKITNFAAAPTVYRSFRAHGYDLPSTLRTLSSAGEPLNASVVDWARASVGIPILDHYGQTELGMVVNNHQSALLSRPVKTGSMGQAMPGFRVVVLDESGEEISSKRQGQIAIDVRNSPLFWFEGYYQDPQATAERFIHDGRYYLTGDMGSVDDEGDFVFTSRADDVILSAGYRIGPVEVESTLNSHPFVAESAAIGIPDTLRGEVIKAFVVLRPDVEVTPQLQSELQTWVKERLAKTAYPREIAIVGELPKTPSGKIQRYILRQQATQSSSTMEQ